MSLVAKVWAVWAVTRLLIVVFTGVTALPHSVWDASAADITLYRTWAGDMVSGHGFPLTDERWQYPPLTGALLVAPWLLGGGHAYNWFFFAVVAAADAGALALLIRAARREGSASAPREGSASAPREGSASAQRGPWMWVLGVALVGRVCYGRIDLVVAVAAIAALLWVTRRPLAAGAAVAAGALLKLWPVLVLLGLRGRALRPVSAAAAGIGAVTAAALTAWSPGAWSFLRFQSERGLQIESPAATPLLIARWIHGGWTITHRYGAEELSGPLVSAVARGCVLATLVGGAALLVVRLRYRPPVADLALCAVLLVMVTSRVLSPQYVVWAVAVAAVCALDPRTTQRPVFAVLLAAAFATQVEFPFVYDRVATGSLPGVIVLTLRNGLLLWAAGWSALLLCRRSAPESPDTSAIADESRSGGQASDSAPVRSGAVVDTGTPAPDRRTSPPHAGSGRHDAGPRTYGGRREPTTRRGYLRHPASQTFAYSSSPSVSRYT
nr:glycosyltransferase 87 family protein [Nocardia bovistercoris]